MLTMRVGTFTRGERRPNLVGTRHQWVLPTKVTHVKREKLCIVHTKTARVGHCAGSPSTCPIQTVCTRHERNVGIGLRRLNLRRATVRGGGRPQKQRSTLPTLKLDSYYGSTCLATFLAKFDKCIEYYNWGECDQLCHLWNSLVETAAQICGSGDQTRLFPS